ISDLKDTLKQKYGDSYHNEANFDIKNLEERLSKIMCTQIMVEEIIKFPPYAWLVLKNRDNFKFVSLVIEDKIFLGDFYAQDGENLSKMIASVKGAKTILEIFNSAINDQSLKKDISNLKENLEISNYLFNSLSQNICGEVINPKALEDIKLIVINSKHCYYCNRLKDYIIKRIDNIPFKIKFIPINYEEIDFNKYSKENDNLKTNDLRKNLDRDLRLSMLEIQNIFNLISKDKKIPFFIWKDKTGKNRIDQMPFEKIYQHII
ncbi:MAG: hypothetical protein IJU40_04420, partial [Desulfovibrionaceae bacterium]|nr:hypothetical protein [Desulfovibrionaceae bacterium]